MTSNLALFSIDGEWEVGVIAVHVSIKQNADSVTSPGNIFLVRIAMAESRKHRTISLEDKVSIITAVKKGEKNNDIASKFYNPNSNRSHG